MQGAILLFRPGDSMTVHGFAAKLPNLMSSNSVSLGQHRSETAQRCNSPPLLGAALSQLLQKASFLQHTEDAPHHVTHGAGP